MDEGAQLLLDGRNVKVQGYENGNFVGPTIICNVTVSVFMQVTNILVVLPKSMLILFSEIM